MIYVTKEPPGSPPKETFLRDFVTFHIFHIWQVVLIRHSRPRNFGNTKIMPRAENPTPQSCFLLRVIQDVVQIIFKWKNYKT